MNNKYQKKSLIYAMYSNLEILKGNIDSGYDYAKKVKEMEKDNPLSNAHPFYLQKSMRCGKNEGLSYIYEYSLNFPNYKQWYKSFKGIETDEQGNETLSQEAREIFDSIQLQFKTYTDLYKNSAIGITTIARGYEQTLPQILDWREIYNIKISITSGNIDEVNFETQNAENKLVIDALGLYILTEIGLLYVLNKFDKVFITFSTISYLQQSLLEIEKPLTREILKYIDEAINIELVCPDFSICKEHILKFEKFFEKNQIDSAVYSHLNSIPYIYSDFKFKPYMENYNGKFMSIIALLRYILKEGFLQQKEVSSAILNLRKFQYDFINFTAIDIYHSAEKCNFDMTDDIYEFFKLTKNIDFVSFARVYIEFLKLIYKNIDRTKFDNYFDLYVQVFDKYIKKTDYYFQCVEIQFGSDFVDIVNYYNDNKNINLIMDRLELVVQLLNSPELNRVVYIIGCCQGAIKVLLHLFSKNPSEHLYYTNRIRKIIRNISQPELEKIINESID